MERVKLADQAQTQISEKSHMKLDLLYELFEKHLNNIEEANDPLAASQKEGNDFVDRVVSDYLTMLRKNNILVPFRWRDQVIDELRDHVRQMLTKKTYGCLSIEEFRTKQKKKSRGRRVVGAAKKRIKKFF